MGKIIFLKAGIFTTIQDRGRLNFLDKGVPLSGPMDEEAFLLANLLAQKDPYSPCLEFYMGNSYLFFTENCQIVCCGARAKIEIDSKVFSNNEIINIEAGSKLFIPPFSEGQWLYMAINGTFETEKVLGSQSFYQKITTLFKYRNNDVLPYLCSDSFIPAHNAKIKTQAVQKKIVLPVYPGPSFFSLNTEQQSSIKNNIFTISGTQNRMGIQLRERLRHDLSEQISSPVYPGTVQLTRAGKLIVLMKDAQVTGGYPRILQLPMKSISKLARLRPHDTIKFHLID
jgi:allophanate hydrolase subunit 2